MNKSPSENNEITQHYTYAARSNYHSSMGQAVLLPPFRLVFLTRVQVLYTNLKTNGLFYCSATHIIILLFSAVAPSTCTHLCSIHLSIIYVM